MERLVLWRYEDGLGGLVIADHSQAAFLADTVPSTASCA
jgi:hypothetical protein